MKLLPLLTAIFLMHSCQSPSEPEGTKPKEEKRREKVLSKAREKIDASMYEKAQLFCVEKGFNSEVAFFSDMSIRSGRSRFFVVDMKKKAIKDVGLVTHGHCKNYTSIKPAFSNEVGSNCTSLGRYKVGYKYEGKFGTAYKLYGLDETNSNAFDRFVVLHSHSCVPDDEAAFGICRSEGCPTVSPSFLSRLMPIIDKSTKPILLWVYN